MSSVISCPAHNDSVLPTLIREMLILPRVKAIRTGLNHHQTTKKRISQKRQDIEDQRSFQGQSNEVSHNTPECRILAQAC